MRQIKFRHPIVKKDSQKSTKDAVASAVEAIVSHPSGDYRAMIYVATATIHLYSKGLKINKEMTVADFRDNNPELMERVFEETKELFNYLISHEQMSRACYAYMAGKLNPQSVFDTDVYKVGG